MRSGRCKGQEGRARGELSSVQGTGGREVLQGLTGVAERV